MTKKETIEVSWTDRILKAVCAIFGVVCLASGIYSGMWHCFMFAGMCAALYWAINHEEGK